MNYTLIAHAHSMVPFYQADHEMLRDRAKICALSSTSSGIKRTTKSKQIIQFSTSIPSLSTQQPIDMNCLVIEFLKK